MTAAAEPAQARPDPPPHDPVALGSWSDYEQRHALRLSHLLFLFVFLGAVCRLARYLTNQPLWGDEAYLAASFIDRGYRGLMDPLEYHQVAPLLYLWAQRAIVDLAGFAAWSLRLLSIVAGLAALPLFVRLSGLALRGVPRLLAVACLAVSFYPIRYATEIKPYACDLAMACVVLDLALRWWRQPAQARAIWLLAAICPLAVGLSHPAVFVAAGANATIWLSLAWRGRATRVPTHLDRRPWFAWRWLANLAFSVSLALSFGLLYILVTGPQAAGAGDGTRAYWSHAFPPRGGIGPSVVWLFDVHTSHMLAYPLGGAHGASVLTAAAVALGAGVLWRQRQAALLGLLLGPLLLGFLAAALGKYPYGGSPRTMQYVAPAFCLLAGLGVARAAQWVRCPSRRARRLAFGLGLLFLVGLGILGLDLAYPYKFLEDRQARDFARAFWPRQRLAEGELVCLRRDLGIALDAKHWHTGRSAVYLCNQAIYAPRSRPNHAPRLDRVNAQWPLRCVLYNQDLQSPALASWLASMRAGYTLHRIERLEPVPLRSVGGLEYEDRYDIFEFTPRAGSAHPGLARRRGQVAR